MIFKLIRLILSHTVSNENVDGKFISVLTSVFIHWIVSVSIISIWVSIYLGIADISTPLA